MSKIELQKGGSFLQHLVEPHYAVHELTDQFDLAIEQNTARRNSLESTRLRTSELRNFRGQVARGKIPGVLIRWHKVCPE